MTNNYLIEGIAIWILEKKDKRDTNGTMETWYVWGERETSEEIKNVVKEIVSGLGPYIKVADWNKKDSIRAKIKMIVKKSLIKLADSKMSYEQIDAIANEILSHMEVIYAAAWFTPICCTVPSKFSFGCELLTAISHISGTLSAIGCKGGDKNENFRLLQLVEKRLG